MEMLVVGDTVLVIEKKTQVFLYVPENFDASTYLGNSQRRCDAANWIIDRIYTLSQFGMQGDEWGFVPLKVEYLRQVIPQTFEKELRRQLQHAGVIECDGHYIKGRKSLGYRLTERFSRQHRRVPVIDSHIQEGILAVRRGDLAKLSPVHRHLHRQFECLTIDLDLVQVDDPERRRWIDFSLLAADQLKTKAWTPTVCDYGRLHTPLTRMMKEFRHGMKLDDKPLINLDIANSQPLILGLLFLKVLNRKPIATNVLDVEQEELLHLITTNTIPNHPPKGGPYTMGVAINHPSVREDVRRYVALTEEGRLYDFLGESSGLGRTAFKQKLFKDVFFGQNYIRSKLTDEFERHFPNVIGFIRRVKKSNFARLAWIMQREESRLMIDTVCRRLMTEVPDLPILTIHDSVMTVPQGGDLVREVIGDEFRRVGLSPTIRTECC